MNLIPSCFLLRPLFVAGTDEPHAGEAGASQAMDAMYQRLVHVVLSSAAEKMQGEAKVPSGGTARGRPSAVGWQPTWKRWGLLSIYSGKQVIC